MSSSSATSISETILLIDGSAGEGGGQVLRNAISYAALMQRPVQVTNIRAKRSKPGLQAQHVTAIQLAVQIADKEQQMTEEILQGNTVGSQIITYDPTGITTTADTTTSKRQKRSTSDPISNNNHHHEEGCRVIVGDVKTAGSICLLLQAALPCALLATATSTKLILKGGTNSSMAPQLDYWERIFLPTLTRRFKIPDDCIQATVLKRGYFPRGGGHVEVTIQPLGATATPRQALLPQSLTMMERGHVVDILIRSFHAGHLPRHLAETMAQSARQYILNNWLHVDQQPAPQIHVEVVTEPNAVGSGVGVLVVATTSTGCLLGGSALPPPGNNKAYSKNSNHDNKNKIDARQVGENAARELMETLQEGGCVDEWLQDQLIVFMALANGTSTLRTGCLTLHTQTAMDVAKQMCPGVEFEVTRVDTSWSEGASTQQQNRGYGQHGRIPGQHIIRCRGIGYTGLPATVTA